MAEGDNSSIVITYVPVPIISAITGYYSEPVIAVPEINALTGHHCEIELPSITVEAENGNVSVGNAIIPSVSVFAQSAIRSSASIELPNILFKISIFGGSEVTFDVPVPEINALTGIKCDIELPTIELESIIQTQNLSNVNVVLPIVTVNSNTGNIGNTLLPVPIIDGIFDVGYLGYIDVLLSKIKIESIAYTDLLHQANIRLPVPIIESNVISDLLQSVNIKLNVPIIRASGRLSGCNVNVILDNVIASVQSELQAESYANIILPNVIPYIISDNNTVILTYDVLRYNNPIWYKEESL